ncbi:MAG: EAL domain-containing protein [Oscillospiraceae bacterium]|nr:EAL domain-containing protein [Oscillospiraceae bacterium]
MEQTEDKNNVKQGKMRTRFLLQCILPAVLVLGLVCFISIYLTRLMACQNMMSSVTGQQTSKIGNFERNMAANLDSVQLESRVPLVLSVTEHNVPAETLYDTTNNMISTSVIMSKIQVVLFDQGLVIGSRGYRSEFEGDAYRNEYWYDAEKINKAELYVVNSTDPSSKENPLYTFVYPVLNQYGESVAAFLFVMNNSAFIPMISMTTNISEQVWMLLEGDSVYYLAEEYRHRQDINDIAAVAASFDNSSSRVRIKNTTYIMRTEKLNYLDNTKLVYAVPVAPIVRQSIPTTILSVLICLVSVVVIFICVMTFSGRIVKEINDVRKSLKGIAGNDFSDPLEVKTNDEMGMLVTEFNGVIETLKFRAEHDGKTSYYNAETFAKKARSFIESDSEKSYAIVRADIDNFSFINDIFDWEVGDRILLDISKILVEVFGKDAVYGYLGNDIFVICVSYVFMDAVFQKIERASERIKENTAKYMPITPHFGICENADPNMDISILCDYAGIALKTIKGNLLRTYAIYDEKFDENHRVQKFVESNKISALENNDFYILLQPKCDINTGEVVGAEALVRWRDHSSGEVISPGKFIPIFEKNGFVITLDRFVWEETCKVIKKWRDLGYRDIPVSVNVSRMHIVHDTFVEDFAALVKKYDIPPHLVEVEITESALLENSEDALQEVMLGLKNKGFKLLMDDFASGYSSLIALQRLPFDVIKIDKGLIDKIGEGFNRDFVAGIIAFLREIRKDIVIEGVEYDWQREILKETGGQVIQGFCFSRPIPVSDFEKLAFETETDI